MHAPWALLVAQHACTWHAAAHAPRLANTPCVLLYLTRGRTQRLEHEGNYIYIICRHNGLAGVCICDQEYPQRVAFAVTTKLLDDFQEQVRVSVCLRHDGQSGGRSAGSVRAGVQGAVLCAGANAATECTAQ